MTTAALRKLLSSREFQGVLKSFPSARWALEHVYQTWARTEELDSQAMATYARFGKTFGEPALFGVLFLTYLSQVTTGGHRHYFETFLAGDERVYRRMRALLKKNGVSRSAAGREMTGLLARVKPGMDRETAESVERELWRLKDDLESVLELEVRSLLGIPPKKQLETPERRRARRMIERAPTLRVPIHLIDLLNAYHRFRKEKGKDPTAEELAIHGSLDPGRVERHFEEVRRAMGPSDEKGRAEP